MERVLYGLILMLGTLPAGSALKGSEGTLKWRIEETKTGVRIEGSAPDFTVTHEASRTLVPEHTERSDNQGTQRIIEYDAKGATIKDADGNVLKRHDQKNIWDADSLEVRLGYERVNGKLDRTFYCIDINTNKLYKMQSKVLEQTQCSGAPCTQVQVSLTGVLKAVGPKWTYWFGDDGGLLRYKGPNGTFEAE